VFGLLIITVPSTKLKRTTRAWEAPKARSGTTRRAPTRPAAHARKEPLHLCLMGNLLGWRFSLLNS
jgi:hypothetical protein